MKTSQRLQQRQRTIDRMAILVSRMKAGDETAFNEYYILTKKNVVNILRDRGVRQADVEDVVQDVYFKVYLEIPNMHDPQSAFKWLNVVASNTAVNYTKSAYVRREKLLVDDPVDAEEPDALPMLENEAYLDRALVSTDKEPELLAEENEVHEQLKDILNSCLSRRELQVVEDYYYREMTVDEIASLNEVSPNTIKTTLYHARKKIETEARKSGLTLYSVSVLPLLISFFSAETAAEIVPAGLDQLIASVPGKCAAAAAAGAAGTEGAAAATGAAGAEGASSATGSAASEGAAAATGSAASEGAAAATGPAASEGAAATASTAGKAAATASTAGKAAAAATTGKAAAAGGIFSAKALATVAIAAAVAVGGITATRTATNSQPQEPPRVESEAEDTSEPQEPADSAETPGGQSTEEVEPAPPTATPLPTNTPTPTPTEIPAEENNLVQLAGTAVQGYRDFLRNNAQLSFADYGQAFETYYSLESVAGEGFHFWSDPTHGQPAMNMFFAYAMEDLNHDGIPELLLADVDDALYQKWLYVLTFEDGEIKPCFAALADNFEDGDGLDYVSSYITRRMIAEEGTDAWFIDGFSYGGDTGFLFSYRIKNDLSGYDTLMHSEYWSPDGVGEEWAGYAARYTEIEPLPFRPLSDLMNLDTDTYYSGIRQSIYEKQNGRSDAFGGTSIPYYLYDMDGDGIDEMFVRTGTYENEYLWEVYTVKEGSPVKLADWYGSHSAISLCPDGGVYLFTDNIVVYITRYTYDGTSLTQRETLTLDRNSQDFEAQVSRYLNFLEQHIITPNE